MESESETNNKKDFLKHSLDSSLVPGVNVFYLKPCLKGKRSVVEYVETLEHVEPFKYTQIQ